MSSFTTLTHKARPDKKDLKAIPIDVSEFLYLIEKFLKLSDGKIKE